MSQKVNVELVRNRAREIRESIDKIRTYVAQPDAEFFFSNILVHRYWEIDQARVVQYTRNNLDDFDEYLRKIGRFVGQQL